MVSFLYRLVFHPFSTISDGILLSSRPAYASLVVLGLLSLQSSCSYFLFFLMPLYGLLLACLVAAYAVAVDFAVQFWRKTGKSKDLFHWFVLAWHPMLFLGLLHVVPFSPLKWAFLYTFFSFTLLIYVGVLQIYVVYKLYGLSKTEATCAYMCPLVIPIGVLGLCVFIFSAYGIFFFRGFL